MQRCYELMEGFVDRPRFRQQEFVISVTSWNDGFQREVHTPALVSVDIDVVDGKPTKNGFARTKYLCGIFLESLKLLYTL